MHTPRPHEARIIMTSANDPPPPSAPADILAGIAQMLSASLDRLATPWTLYQLAVILVCYGLAVLAARRTLPKLKRLMRHLRGQRRLRQFVVIIARRLRWLILPLLLWAAAFLLREAATPDRSYFVAVAASLATAWAVISVASRVIRRRPLANALAITLWTVTALHITGLLDPAIALLDRAAFSVGSFRLSLWMLVKGVLLLSVLLWAAATGGSFLDHRIREHLDIDPTLQVLLGKVVKFTLLAVALLAGLSAIGIELTALTVFSGAVGLGIGFGLQKVASNLMSGMIILLDRSIKPGDVISLGDTFGWISSLRARYVSVVTRDGVEYLIPNESFITEQVVNWSYTNRRVRVEVRFGVSYDSDPHEVRALALDVLKGRRRVLSRPPPVCHLVAFGDSSLDFVLRFWISDPQNGLTNIRGIVLLALWDAFKEKGITIPFPHRQLLLDKPVQVEMSAPIAKPEPRKRAAARRGSAAKTKGA